MIKVKVKKMIKVKVEVKVEDFLCMIHHQIIFLA